MRGVCLRTLCAQALSMRTTYKINKASMLLYILLKSMLVMCSMISIIIIYYFAAKNLIEAIVSVLFLFFILFLSLLAVFPSSWIVSDWNRSIERNVEALVFIKKDKYKKICSWNQIKRIKYNNKFLTPEAHVIIYYVDDKIDVSEKIPIYINNLRQLYKEIYENVKEKSPNAKIDRRFIKYVEEKC